MPWGHACCLVFWMLRPSALQGTHLPGLGEIPVQLIQALPYALTVVLLAGFMGRAVAPKRWDCLYSKDR